MIPVILLAFANDRLGRFLRSIAEEQRAIRKALDPLVQRNLVQVETLSNATAGDIFEAFRTYGDRIQILHYGGHAQDLELMLTGAERPLDVQGLATFLGQQQGLELVFMNGCATAAQQPVLHKAGIPRLILTNTAINDRAALQFASQFYQGMAAGRTVSRSFAEAEGATIAQIGGETRGLVLDEEAEEIDGLPWRLHEHKQNFWTLPTKAPFPTRLVAIIAVALFLLGGSGYSLWRYVIPFDMQVQVLYPEGTNANQFGPGELMQHNLQIQANLTPQQANLDLAGLTSFSMLRGQGRKVSVRLQSNIFELTNSQITLGSGPVPIQLAWKPSQTFISGMVVDEDTNLPIQDVVVACHSVELQTDASGKFKFQLPLNKIGERSHVLSLRHPNYRLRTWEINLIGGEGTYTIPLVEL